MSCKWFGRPSTLLCLPRVDRQTSHSRLASLPRPIIRLLPFRLQLVPSRYSDGQPPKGLMPDSLPCLAILHHHTRTRVTLVILPDLLLGLAPQARPSPRPTLSPSAYGAPPNSTLAKLAPLVGSAVV